MIQFQKCFLRQAFGVGVNIKKGYKKYELGAGIQTKKTKKTAI